MEAINENVAQKSSNQHEILIQILIRTFPCNGQYIRKAEFLLTGLCDLSGDKRRLNPANNTTQIKHQDLREYC